MTTTSKSKTFRPRTVRTSGNAPAERHEALRRTPSLGFLLPKQINFMATYSKELAQNWINKYNNSEAKAEGISFEDFLMDCMMDYGHNEEAAVAACESTNIATFVPFCEEVNGGAI